MGKWLVKSDPDSYSFADLAREKSTAWTGVRNALAQQHLRKMKKGDPVLVYHSGKDKAIVGLAEVKRDPYADPTDETGKSSCVDLKYSKTFKSSVSLASLKKDSRFKDFILVKFSRLSVMPVSDEQWEMLSKLTG